MAVSSPYEPLDKSRQQIRLMSLLPTDDESITCIVEIFEIESTPAYRALSYEWGSTERMHTITINGCPKQIRWNLFDFLEIYRRRQEQGWIWIDQLCIDQDSLVERNHQVGLMEYIFRGAQETLVWLGHDPDDGVALEAFRCVAEDTPKWSDAEQAAIRRFLCLTYWSRHWIAQEIMLSKTVLLLHGTDELKWEIVCRNLYSLSSNCAGANSSTELPLQTFVGFTLKWSKDFDRLDSWAMQGYASFAEQSLCQDPRDKIYGTRSLFPTSLRMPVDYAMSARNLYCKMINLWAQDEQARGSSPFHFLVNCEILCHGMGLTTRRLGYENMISEYESYCKEKGLEHKTLTLSWDTPECFQDLVDFIEYYLLDADEESASSA